MANTVKLTLWVTAVQKHFPRNWPTHEIFHSIVESGMINIRRIFRVVFVTLKKTKHDRTRFLKSSSLRLPPAVTAKSRKIHERFKPVGTGLKLILSDGFA